MTTKPTITTEELDRAFDDGEDVLQHFDLTQAHRPNLGRVANAVEIPWRHAPGV